MFKLKKLLPNWQSQFYLVGDGKPDVGLPLVGELGQRLRLLLGAVGPQTGQTYAP